MSASNETPDIDSLERFSLIANSSSTGLEADRDEKRRQRVLDLATGDPSDVAEKIRTTLNEERSDMLDVLVAKLGRMYRVKNPSDDDD